MPVLRLNPSRYQHSRAIKIICVILDVRQIDKVNGGKKDPVGCLETNVIKKGPPWKNGLIYDLGQVQTDVSGSGKLYTTASGSKTWEREK